MASVTTCIEGSFVVAPDRKRVSYLLVRPPSAHALLVLGHGAGTHLHHPFMRRLAEELGASGVATFRYNYPYSETGKGGMDPENVRLATIQAATETAVRCTPDLPLFAGGHSMSGRMTTLAMAHGIIGDLVGVVALAFPLHPRGKPSMSRADHLVNVPKPILFISGTRDRMAHLDLLHQVVDELASSTRLHVLEGADHGFNGLRRSGPSRDEILAELVQTTADWTTSPTTR